jgi:hypothetical protein
MNLSKTSIVKEYNQYWDNPNIGKQLICTLKTCDDLFSELNVNINLNLIRHMKIDYVDKYTLMKLNKLKELDLDLIINSIEKTLNN